MLQDSGSTWFQTTRCCRATNELNTVKFNMNIARPSEVQRLKRAHLQMTHLYGCTRRPFLYIQYTYVTDVVLAVYIGILHVTSSLQSNKFTVSKVICFGEKNQSTRHCMYSGLYDYQCWHFPFCRSLIPVCTIKITIF